MEKKSKCVICNRIIEGSPKIPFCSLHTRAYSNLIAKYGEWKNAYGDLSPREFLDRIGSNEYSGRWVKEVVNAILFNRELMQVFLDDLSFWNRRD
ncbi:MAG: hypothetical protein NZ873_02585 [Crenarchaeota archaeon]|nr:hypothetical protein [Thermoproteota archaeon]MDW8034243.1 hypothetical protein [Nitrososphaerota archaeon]